MLKFAVIAEGPSDQKVIESLLLGYFQDEEEEPVVNYIQPLPASVAVPSPPGGWTLVFQSLQRGEPQKALQFNDYLIIHIDTDVQEEEGFNVPRRKGGKELSVPERVAAVVNRLIKDIDEIFYQSSRHRIVFAVAVDSIECWLLPLLHADNKSKGKAEKTTGCLAAANHELRRLKKKGLSAGDGKKFPIAYEAASRDYLQRKVLVKHRNRNPSLKLFIDNLDALNAARLAHDPTTPQEGAEIGGVGGNPPE